MRNLIRSAVLALGLLPGFAHAQSNSFPQTLPPNTVVGRLGVSAGPTQAIPFINFVTNLPLASGKILIGSAGGFATPQTPSGDCTFSLAGLIICTQSAGNFTVIGNLTVGGSVIDGNGILATNIAAPATPASGTTRLYVDSTTKTLTAKNDTGALSNTVAPRTCSASQWVAAIASNAIVTCSQPNFADIAGVGACSQEPALTGAVTSSAGSCATTVVTNANLTGPVTSVGNATTLGVSLLPEGRLTLSTGAPVMTSTVSAATSVLYTLYNGNLVPIYNGANFVATTFTELSNVNANSSVGSAGPAAVANSSCYDYFVWSNAGTPTLTRGPAWTSTTARSAGTALVRTNGILLNSVTITNGPAASRGTYVGTACSNGTATFDWILGGSASGGVAAVLNVWNYYNRINVSTIVFDTGVGYTYTSATPRQARASAGNQISFVAGLVEDGFTAVMVGQANTVAVIGATVLWGVGLNSTSTFAAGRTFGQAATANATVFGSSATANLTPQLGLNVISANEASDGANANTFDNNSLNNLSATLRM